MIDVLIPCHNEGDTIGPLVASLLKSDTVLGVTVVDNGSTDDTAIVADRAGATVIWAPIMGKGQALAVGIKYVRSYRVLLCDGDMSPIPTPLVDAMTNTSRKYRDAMLVGIPDFTRNVPWANPGGIWNQLSGIRSLPVRVLFELMQEGLLFGYTVEVLINRHMVAAGRTIREIPLAGVKGKSRFGTERMDAINRDLEWLRARGIFSVIGGKHESTGKAS